MHFEQFLPRDAL